MPPRFKSTKRSKPVAYERDVQAEITGWLTLAGIPFSVTDASLALGPDGRPRRKVATGWPDLTGVLPGGRALFIETKAEDGAVRREQLETHARLRLYGAVVVVARSLGDVVEAVAVEANWAVTDKLRRAIDAVRREQAKGE